MDIMTYYGLVGLCFMMFILLMLIMLVWKSFINAITAKLFKKGKLVVEKYHSNGLVTRQIIKVKDDKINFGNKDGAIAFWNKKAYNFDDETGLPKIVFVEGTLSNVDITTAINGSDYLKQWFLDNPDTQGLIEKDVELKKSLLQLDVSAKYPADEISKIVNQTAKREVELGIMIGKKQALGGNNQLLLILIVLVIAAVGLVGLLLYQQTDAILAALKATSPVAQAVAGGTQIVTG